MHGSSVVDAAVVPAAVLVDLDEVVVNDATAVVATPETVAVIEACKVARVELACVAARAGSSPFAEETIKFANVVSL